MLRVKKKFSVESFGLSHTGLVRTNNEDAWLALPEYDFYILADGMGGHNAGEVAANEAILTLSKIIKKKLKQSYDLESIRTFIQDAIEEANLLVHAKAHTNLAFKGMGTTLCCSYFHPDGLVLGHVGDSRIYRLRKGALQLMTRDDSLLMDLVDKGRMSEEDVEQFNYKNIITKAIGTEPVIDPTVEVFDVEVGDQLMMCSDGLSDLLSHQEIQSTMIKAKSLQESVETLVKTANGKGGHDNITVVQMSVSHARNLP